MFEERKRRKKDIRRGKIILREFRRGDNRKIKRDIGKIFGDIRG